MRGKNINIEDKELDRDIINLNLPEIDWTEPSTGYPDDYAKDSIERRNGSNSKLSENEG